MELAISTKWSIGRHHTAESLVSEVADMGLDAIEVGCDTWAEMALGIAGLVETGRARVSSLHNYCPAPTDRKPDGDSYLLSDLDGARRDEAVRKTRESLVWASRLHARVLVVHLGRVEVEEVTSGMREMHRTGQLTDNARVAAISRSKLERAKRERDHLEAVRRSLAELLPVAEGLGVTIGVENRLRHRQIPLPHEVDILLREFQGAPIGYWHDVGHAEFLQRLGFLKATDYMEALDGPGGRALVGAHIHDVRGLTDHLPPGLGDADFSLLAGRLGQGACRVLEVAAGSARADVEAGAALVRHSGLA